MQVKKLLAEPVRTFAVVLDPGEEAVACLTAFARDHRIDAASFTGLGAFSRVVLGYFDLARKDYDRIELDEQVEVASLVGNFAAKDGSVALHAHIVVGRSDGRAFGGHLLEGQVRPTLEVVVEETPAHLRRVMDDQTGLALLDL